MIGRVYWHIIVISAAVAMITHLNAASAGTEPDEVESGRMNAATHILDGKKFKGRTGEKGKKTHHEDMLVFDDGRFTSTECLQFGFKSGPYTAAVQSDAIRFQAVTLSSNNGKMEWEGTLKGNTIDVTYSWTKERWFWTTHREYWFKGTLVK